MENKEGDMPDKVVYDKPAYTKVVWAGKRRYFFDVLSTRAGEKYISITESRKKTDSNGQFYFDNQKLFLFKEDFEKFSSALTDMIDFIVDGRINEDDEEYRKSTRQIKEDDSSISDPELDKFKVENIEFEQL